MLGCKCFYNLIAFNSLLSMILSNTCMFVLVFFVTAQNLKPQKSDRDKKHKHDKKLFKNILSIFFFFFFFKFINFVEVIQLICTLVNLF